jgi:tetratricopeptide (TPR) repeat protein
MRTWILIVVVTVAVAAGTLTARESDSKELAKKGYSAFREVLAGDEAKLPEAIRYLEEARKADETYVPNLFNLARAYFFEGITFNKDESISKAEKTFARVVELDPSRMDALSFHGAILAQMSGGRDMAMFMHGAQELKGAGERAPNDLTVRIVRSFTAFNLPPEALPFIGNADTLGDLQFIGRAFDSFSSDFAPHASVVMNAFIGEAYLTKGDKEKARASFESALKVESRRFRAACRRQLGQSDCARMKGGGKPYLCRTNIFRCAIRHLRRS